MIGMLDIEFSLPAQPERKYRVKCAGWHIVNEAIPFKLEVQIGENRIAAMLEFQRRLGAKGDHGEEIPLQLAEFLELAGLVV